VVVVVGLVMKALVLLVLEALVVEEMVQKIKLIQKMEL
jgi:hypothetical protein